MNGRAAPQNVVKVVETSAEYMLQTELVESRDWNKRNYVSLPWNHVATPYAVYVPEEASSIVLRRTPVPKKTEQHDNVSDLQ